VSACASCATDMPDGLKFCRVCALMVRRRRTLAVSVRSGDVSAPIRDRSGELAT